MVALSTTRPIDRSQVPADLRAVRRSVCEEIAAACASVYAGRLRAVVLTGSLARNETSFLREGERWKLLSDADCLLVFATRVAHPPASELDELASKIERGLVQSGVLIHISICAVGPAYFESLAPTSFSYELRACGEVIWGDSGILELVPHWTASDLSLEDAWWTLCNRIIELLVCFETAVLPIDQVDAAAEYATVKLYLDMATSYLIFVRQYLPTYTARAQRLRELANGAASVPFPLNEFARCVSQATERKLSGQPWSGASWAFVEEAVRYAHCLWSWEMERLTGAVGESPIRLVMRHAARSQTLLRRARGWLSVLRRTAWFANWREWPRWARLSCRATPRYLVYATAMELFSRLPCLARSQGKPAGLDIDWDNLQALLPERSRNSSQIGDWRQLVAEINWNYKKFLMETQA